MFLESFQKLDEYVYVYEIYIYILFYLLLCFRKHRLTKLNFQIVFEFRGAASYEFSGSWVLVPGPDSGPWPLSHGLAHAPGPIVWLMTPAPSLDSEKSAGGDGKILDDHGKGNITTYWMEKYCLEKYIIPRDDHSKEICFPPSIIVSRQDSLPSGSSCWRETFRPLVGERALGRPSSLPNPMLKRHVAPAQNKAGAL